MKIKALLILLTFGMLMTACQKDVPEPQEKPYQVNVNPNSNHIMRAKQDDGTVVNYYGKKDEAGRTEQIQLVSLQSPDEELPDLLYFNDSYELSRIQAADGSQYQFEWLSETEFRLTATTADKSQQVSIPVDLTEVGLQKPVSNTAPYIANPLEQPRQKTQRAGRARMEVRPLESSESPTSISERDNDRLATIFLTRCGETIPLEEYPSYPVSVNFLSVPDLQGYILPEGNSNQYIIPEYGVPGTIADLADICSSISTNLGYVCTALGPIASNEGAVAGICGLLQFYAPGTFLFCTRSFDAIEKACLFIGSPEIGVPSIADEFCKLVGQLESTLTPDYVRLGIYGYPDASTIDLPYDGPFGNVYLEIPGAESAIENLAINPVDPAPGQNYLATANIHCAAGKQVSISIVGTDGYVDSNAFTAQGSISIYLYVPGAEDGVKDIITVEVEDGPQMVTSIVF